MLAIDGEELKATDDPYRLLRNKADNPVSADRQQQADDGGFARTVSYRPITDEGNLIYLDWVTRNRKRVEEASGGRVGYIHVPDMGANGIREFIKWYYPQMDKEGSDRRRARQWRRQCLAHADRASASQTAGVNYARTDDAGNTYPDGVFIGPMVALLDQNSASDGDIFPYMFREAGLGPLIGKRSWGGVVGIGNRGPLIDGGSSLCSGLSACEQQDGQWIIEGSRRRS